jgi:hypothetical protein
MASALWSSPLSAPNTKENVNISVGGVGACPARWLGELGIAPLHLTGHHLECGVLGPNDGPGWVPAVHRDSH